MAKQEFLDRSLYRRIKGMNREQMEAVIQEFYNMGAESVKGGGVDLDAIRQGIGQIKGIGESRLNEIMLVIEEQLKRPEGKE